MDEGILRSHLRAEVEAETGLKHVPILHPQVGEQERVEGVRVKVYPVAVRFPGIEIVRPPDNHAVLYV